MPNGLRGATPAEGAILDVDLAISASQFELIFFRIGTRRQRRGIVAVCRKRQVRAKEQHVA